MGLPGFLQEGNREESSSDCKKQSVRMIVLKGRKVSSASGGRLCVEEQEEAEASPGPHLPV